MFCDVTNDSFFLKRVTRSDENIILTEKTSVVNRPLRSVLKVAEGKIKQ